MTKKEYLEWALKSGGMKGRIYMSVKELKHAQGTSYGAVLRVKDTPRRSSSKKQFRDQTDAPKQRRRLYEMTTLYNVVIAGATEKAVEQLLEGFLANLEKGYFDNQNWVSVEPQETEWVDEEDSVMKSKVAVQILVEFQYGIYKDVSLAGMEGEPRIETQKG